MSDASDLERRNRRLRAAAVAAAAAGKAATARAQRRWSAKAAELGYPHARDMIAATIDLTAKDAAAVLGCSRSQIANLRARYGPPPTQDGGPGRRWLQAATLHGLDVEFDCVPGTLPELPLGVQPEWDSKLLCRVCGHWFRGLGAHLVRAHDQTRDQYREEFELPATAALLGEETRAVFARHARRRLATDPRIQAAIPPTREQLDERRHMALEAKKRTGGRAGVQIARRRATTRLSEANVQRSQRERTRLDDIARRHGSADFPTHLKATSHLPASELATMLGCSLPMVAYWRGHFGVRSTTAAHRRSVQAQRVQALLAEIPNGTQPVDDTGRLMCLDCGHWHHDLAQHLGKTHHIDTPAYRQQHALPADLALVNDTVQNRRTRTRLSRTNQQSD